MSCFILFDQQMLFLSARLSHIKFLDWKHRPPHCHEVEDMTKIDLELSFEFSQIIHYYAQNWGTKQVLWGMARKYEGLFFHHPSNSDQFHERHGNICWPWTAEYLYPLSTFLVYARIYLFIHLFNIFFSFFFPLQIWWSRSYSIYRPISLWALAVV